MNCTDFEELLDELLDEPSSDHFDPVRRRRAMRHLGGCTECLELARLAGLVEGWDPRGAPEDLLASVVHQTSGSPCRQAEEQLGEYVDGTLTPGDRELIQLHLEGCSACTSLAAQLVHLSEVLPRLASLDPGPAFVDHVLAATLPRSVRLRRWWSSGWQRWVRRPRFSAELAYVATLIVVLVFGMPWSPATATPRKMVELVRVESVLRWQEGVQERLRPSAHELAARLEGRLTEVKNSKLTRTLVEIPANSQRTSARVAEQVKSWMLSASQRIGTFWRWAASRLMNAEELSFSPDTPTKPSEPTQSSEESHDEPI